MKNYGKKLRVVRLFVVFSYLLVSLKFQFLVPSTPVVLVVPVLVFMVPGVVFVIIDVVACHYVY